MYFLFGAVIYLFVSGHYTCWPFQEQFGCALTSDYWTAAILAGASLGLSLWRRLRWPALAVMVGIASIFLVDRGVWSIQNWYSLAYPTKYDFEFIAPPLQCSVNWQARDGVCYSADIIEVLNGEVVRERAVGERDGR